MRSLLVAALLLDVEVLDLVGGLVDGDDVKELSETVSLEVLLGKVLQVSFRECNIGLDCDFLVVTVDLNLVAELAGLAVDFDSVLEELCEVGGVEDLVLHGLGAVNNEGAGDLGFGLLGDLLALVVGLDRCLFCGHHNIYFILLFNIAPRLPPALLCSFLPLPSPFSLLGFSGVYNFHYF